MEIETVVSIAEPRKPGQLGNLILEKAKFFGRPNFSGEMDRFKDDRRKFTVVIPNEVADQLRELGWNVKTLIADEEQKAEGREDISILKVMVDTPRADTGSGSSVTIVMGREQEQLTLQTFSLMDRARIQEMDMEIRAWEYDPDERPGQYSARLVALYANIEMSRLDRKYANLGGES